MFWHPKYIVLIFGIILFIILSSYASFRESLTYDETVNIQEGRNAWKFRTFDIDTNNLPLPRNIATIPIITGLDRLLPVSPTNVNVFFSRFVMILIGAFGLALVYMVSYRLTKSLGASALTLFLYIFEPSILAHSHYIVNNIWFLVLYFFLWVTFLAFADKSTKRNSLVFGVALGLSLSSKLLTTPFFLTAVILYLLFSLRKNILHMMKNMLPAVIALFFVLWANYFFTSDVIIKARNDPNRVSERLLTYARDHRLPCIEKAIWFGQHQPVPLGQFFASVKNTVLFKQTDGGVFFLGNVYQKSQWYFMPVMFVLKTPIPLLILFSIGCIEVLKRRKTDKGMDYLIPVVAIFIVTSWQRMALLTRYILPVIPFVIIIASQAMAITTTKIGKTVLFVLLLWYIVGTLRYFPHTLSFSNEFTGEREGRYQLFSDSNIDWGQALPDVADYISKTQPSSVKFSYFGRDNADLYGLFSDRQWGSFRFKEICAFHQIARENGTGDSVTLISVSNWHMCGYEDDSKYLPNRLKKIIADSILVY